MKIHKEGYVTIIIAFAFLIIINLLSYLLIPYLIIKVIVVFTSLLFFYLVLHFLEIPKEMFW